MSTNDRGEPGLQYPNDLPQSIPIPLHKAVRMIVDNLYFLRGKVTEISGALGVSTVTTQQLINQTIKNVSGGGGGGGGGGSSSITVLVSTHAIRLGVYGAATDPVGSLFIETDRCSIYYISDAFGIPRWVFAAGMMTGAIAAIPTDLATDDAGFSFVATDATELTDYVWTGAQWLTVGGLRQIVTDAVTAASSNVFRMAHRSSGVPATNFGAIERTELDNASNALVDAAAVDTWWTTATAGSETSAWAIMLRNAGAALADYFQILITGIRFKVGGFFGKLTHANSADHIYTFPNADGNITYETAALTLNNFLFGGGLALVKDAGFAIVPVANGGTGVSYNRIADTIALTNQVAGIGSTNFANGGVVGTYRVSYSLEDTTLDLLAGTIQLQVTYTDDAGAATVSSIALPLTALGRTTDVFFLQLASGNIAYSTTLVGIIGTAKYALYICLERLS